MDRTNELELVESENNNVEEFDGYGIEESTENSDDAGLDLTKVLTWGGLIVATAVAVVIGNKDRLSEASRKRDEKRMRKLAAKLGYDVVDPDKYVEAECEECDETVED